MAVTYSFRLLSAVSVFMFSIMPRDRLGLGRAGENTTRMAIGVESRGESYGLLIDAIGEVLKLDEGAREPSPINLDPRLARVSAGVYRLEGQLLMIVDIDRVLDIGVKAITA